MMKAIFFVVFLAACGIPALTQTTSKHINGGVLNGKAISLPKPEYPDTARNAGLEGTVRVAIEIDEAGNVVSAIPVDEPQKARNSAGEEIELRAADPILRDAGERAAWGARFSPTLLNGNPVRVKGVIVYDFRAKSLLSEGLPPGVGVVNGRAISLPKPPYPPAAAAVRAGGAVSVLLTIDEQGNVTSAEAISGHPLLRAAAVTAAKGARFRPLPGDGGPPPSSKGVLVYNFIPPDPRDQ